ncbi:MAG: nucleotidyltransferase family protein [Erysipelotrichia bacterium]|nr:nucleotidyltransferase family protein [Erysipelotrichia bacterium]
MKTPKTLTAITLLAGNSQRMGRLKQHIELNGKTFLQHIIQKLLLARPRFSRLIFVGQLTDKTAQQQVKDVAGVWVNNPRPEDGSLSSIRLALKATDVGSAILLWPADHPMVAQNTLESLIQAWLTEPDKITVPSDGAKRGHPTIFPAWCRDEFYSTELESGAKKILQTHPEKINHVLTNDIWVTKNLNTPQLLAEAELQIKADKKQL